MFSVKATYNNETRKFSFKEANFPSYSSICSQLYRVFPIRGSYYLSKLLFSPSEGTRVVVGKEVHDEAEYNAHIAPFVGRIWPGGLLRFSVIDETPHKLPGGFPVFQVENVRIPQVAESPDLKFLSGHRLRRPPPIPKDDMDVDCGTTTAIPASNRNSMLSQSSQQSQQSCCSVAEGKIEMKSLMTSFLQDLDQVMFSTFGEKTESQASVTTPRAAYTETDRHDVGETPIAEQKENCDVVTLPIPGAFFQPTPPVPVATSLFATTTGIPTPIPTIRCSFCKQYIRGTRFKCTVCPDFDVCEGCDNQKSARTIHQAVGSVRSGGIQHTFSTIPTVNTTVASSIPQPLVSSSTLAQQPPSLLSAPVIHSGITCDMCNHTVIGLRHKCLDCPDYDLCDNCFPRASPAHHVSHQFFAIEKPGHVIVHTVFDGDGSQDRFRQVSQPVQHLPRPLPRSGSIELPVHQANCDLCDSRIRGARYKCLSCPDFDACASCYRIAPEQHPRHTFVKIDVVQDLTPRDPNAYVKHNARCDECSKTIRGIRFKCMHPECPDYDLCERCEAIPIEVHPSTHPMLKMRSPNTVVPTVYRFGGTTLINPLVNEQLVSNPGSVVHCTGVAIATDPEPEKADASVHVELKWPETSEAAVSTTIPISTSEALESSIEIPALPTPPPQIPGPVPENLRLLVDYFKQGVAPNASNPGETNNKSETTMFQPDMPSFISNFLARYPPVAKSTELRAAFVSDNNIEDGQVFPAGAEFVKSWRMRNDGEVAWPETTELVFVAGDRLPAFEGAANSFLVGKVEPAATVDIYAADMKAPEAPGKYVGYWRLSDGTKLFGASVWCDIIVPAETGPACMHDSLTASEMIMPESAPARSLAYSVAETNVDIGLTTPELAPLSTVPSTPTMASDSSNPSSEDGDSSASLLDEFETASDAEFWEASRSEIIGQPVERGDLDYVVLYDEETTDDEGH